MAKGLEYRALGRRGVIIPTPLYADDQLMAHVVLGEYADHWREVRRVLERDGMPSARPSMLERQQTSTRRGKALNNQCAIMPWLTSPQLGLHYHSAR